MYKSKTLIAVLLLCVIGIGLVVAVNFVTRSIPSSGTVFIKTLGIEAYSDVGCTQVVQSLVWGTLSPGDSKVKTIYVKNTGNTAVTLNMTTGNWTPANAGAYITLSWDAEGVTLSPSAVRTAVITLAVSSGAPEMNFSLNIVLEGTE